MNKFPLPANQDLEGVFPVPLGYDLRVRLDEDEPFYDAICEYLRELFAPDYTPAEIEENMERAMGSWLYDLPIHPGY